MPTLKYFCQHPRKIVIPLLTRFGGILPDKQYLQLMFHAQLGYKLNLKNPKTFNEKLQWLKLYDRRPEYTQMVDKVEAKKYVSNIIGEEHIIPTLAVYDRAEDINFDTLPNQFVLKVTHDSGGIVICKDKAKLDRREAIMKLSQGLKENFFYMNREWPYKNVQPRIIAEKYMCDEYGELRDYKWFCFDGEPKAMFVATDRFAEDEETKFDFFDVDFNHLPFTNGHPNAIEEIKKPTAFEGMKKLAAQLSRGLTHVRVDFYEVNGHIYFGELTFYHWSGFKNFNPSEWDLIFGSWMKLPINKA